MKNLSRGLGLIGLFSMIQLSCDNDPFNEEGDVLASIEVQFQAREQQVDENAAEGTVVLQLSKPAAQDVILSLQPGEGYEGVLTTLPGIENGLINIRVLKGEISAEIKIKPVDNSQKDGHKVVNFKLHTLPSPFTAGSNNSLDLTVNDDETANPGQQSFANFIDQDTTLEETNPTGIEYKIHFSKAVWMDSEIRITLTSEKATYGLHYETEPAAENNVITLPVTTGLMEIGFKVKGVNNSEITGEFNLDFTIANTNGSISKGDNLTQSLLIKDEELAQKPKGYVISSADATARRFYEYDAQGRIAKVKWETFTSFLTQGTDTYFYDDSDRLIKINKRPGADVVYQWSDGRIVRSEEVRDGVVKSYTEYAYDEAGNVGGTISYHRQENGTYVKGFFVVYLYYQDGNLYKSLLYNDNLNNPEEPWLVSAKTYDNYIDVSNPYPMAEVLPLVKSQTKLSTTYRLEENGLDLTYNLVYKYRADGLPEKRVATAPGDIQTAVYYYY